jgi:arylsulfatase A-like enzyme
LLGEHDLMDKRWFFEESMRMPFIVHWPAVVRGGSVNRWLINNTDFAPTLIEIAGAKVPNIMQGRSFAAALRGASPPADWRTVTYYRYWMHMAHDLAVPAHFAIRSDRHKLVFLYGIDALRPASHPTPAAWEFYDLETDPGEMKNQYGNPAYAEVITAMKRQLRETRAALGETDRNFPEVQQIIDAHN